MLHTILGLCVLIKTCLLNEKPHSVIQRCQSPVYNSTPCLSVTSTKSFFGYSSQVMSSVPVGFFFSYSVLLSFFTVCFPHQNHKSAASIGLFSLEVSLKGKTDEELNDRHGHTAAPSTGNYERLMSAHTHMYKVDTLGSYKDYFSAFWICQKVNTLEKDRKQEVKHGPYSYVVCSVGRVT